MIHFRYHMSQTYLSFEISLNLNQYNNQIRKRRAPQYLYDQPEPFWIEIMYEVIKRDHFYQLRNHVKHSV